MRGDGPDWLDEDQGYTFLVLAAHEARKASRRYWAKGGAADLRYPVHEDSERNWPLRGKADTAPTRNDKAWITKRRERE